METATVGTASPVDLSDLTSLELLIQALDSTDQRQVVHSLELLEANNKGHLVPRLLLSHGATQVRRRTLRVFAVCGREDAAPMVERLLTDDDLDVRVEAIRTLAALQGRDSVAMMLPRLEDPNLRIRAAAIAAVAGHGAEATEKAAKSLSGLLTDARWTVRQDAARILGELSDPLFESHLIQLTYDADHRVAREAIKSVRTRIDRDAFNPVYGPILISALRHRRLKHEARNAVVACGEHILPALVHFLNDPHESIWVRRAIPKTLACINTPGATRALTDALDADDPFVVRKVIEALGSTPSERARDPAMRAALRRRLSREVGTYLRQVADLFGLGLEGDDVRFLGPKVVWNDRPPTLLHHLLTDRVTTQLDNIFRLLAVLHDPTDIWAAHNGLVGRDAARRTHALEYLDNTLRGEVRTTVFAAIGDVPHFKKFQNARDMFGVEIESRERTLRRLMTDSPDGDGDAAWVSAAAVHAVYAAEVPALYPYVQKLVDHANDPLVRETAQWVSSRLD